MGRVLKDLYLRKLPKIRSRLADALSRSDDEFFLQMTWAVDALQSAREVNVGPYLEYDDEANTADISAKYFIYKWELETLVNLLLSTKKARREPGSNRMLDCRKFGAMVHVVRLLRRLEDSEYAVRGHPETILSELHRIGQRQFGWQRGFATSERLYRFAFVYGQGRCAEYFEETHGISISDFMQTAFTMYAALGINPWIKPPVFPEVGMDKNKVDKLLRFISRDCTQIRVEATSLINPILSKNAHDTGYLPSVLRRFPIISSSLSGRIVAPLPELIIFRATAGLYYDLREGPQHILAEANDRFEKYAGKIVEGFCKQFIVLPSQDYGPRKFAQKTPDVLIKHDGKIVAVIECKATKLTYEAQFALSPIDEAEKAYRQIIKGVVQLWRFFSHARIGQYTGENLSQNSYAIVLTMDSWMQMSGELRDEVIARAKEMAKDHAEITDLDMRPIIFCSIQELADVLFTSDEEQLLQVFHYATQPKYRGWGIVEVRRDAVAEGARKEFPFSIDDLLPWWKRWNR